MTKNNRPKVLITNRLPNQVETRMAELFDCRFVEGGQSLSEKEIVKLVADFDVLVPTITDKIHKSIINAGKKLQLIANFGVGIDHIDHELCEKKGIIVTNTPDVLTDDTADFTIALILAISRRIIEGQKKIENGQWPGWQPTWMMGNSLRSKRIGIIGMGRIGQEVARLSKAFNMFVHYHNRNRVSSTIEKELEASFWPELDQMLSHVDYVSINCPLTKNTVKLIDKRRLAMLKKTAYIVNTARGEIIDQEALIQALKNKQIAGAALDVYVCEPKVPKELYSLNNVICLPHISSATIETRTAMAEKVLINIRAWHDNHRPPDRVLNFQTS